MGLATEYKVKGYCKAALTRLSTTYAIDVANDGLLTSPCDSIRAPEPSLHSESATLPNLTARTAPGAGVRGPGSPAGP